MQKTVQEQTMQKTPIQQAIQQTMQQTTMQKAVVKMPITIPITILQRVWKKVMRPLLLVAPLWLACQSMAYAENWKVNLQEADIRAFINEVANITNKNFVLDPRINGNVTVISNRPMTEAEIYQLFLSVMQVNGVMAIDKGGIIELKPDNLAKSSGIPVDLNESAKGQQMVTRVIYLNNTQASEILSVIRPLLPQTAHAMASPGVNALVLSDRADSLNQLSQLIRDLDSDLNDSLVSIPLNHTDSERMLELISELTGTATTGQAQAGSSLRIIADTKSDRLLVKGNPIQIAKIQAMVARLDTIPNKPLSSMQVFRLNYSDSAHVATIIRAMVTGSSINSTESASTLTTASLSGKNATGKANSSKSSSSSTRGGANSGGKTATDRYGHPFSIIADETRNTLYINASSPTMADIEGFIKQIDTPEVQVLIQAAIIEVSGDDLQQLGIQWALGSPSTGYSLTNFNNSGTSITALAGSILSKSTLGVSSAATSIAGALLGLGGSRRNSKGETEFYGAILQAIDKTTSANLLSTPSITTLNHKEANLLVGQNVPFITGSYTNNTGSNGGPFQTVERQDVGIQLNVIPHVGTDGVVKLEVSQEVSSVVESSTNNVSGLTTNKSAINTTVMAKDGETVALGGLMREKNSQSQQKVPKLGDIPLLGRMFRSDDNSSQKSNLIIFLRPTVLKNGGVIPSMTEIKDNQRHIMQLVIDPNGTIRRVPLSSQRIEQASASTQNWIQQYTAPNANINTDKGTKLNDTQDLMQLEPVSQPISQPMAQSMPQSVVESASKPTAKPMRQPSKRIQLAPFPESEEFSKPISNYSESNIKQTISYSPTIQDNSSEIDGGEYASINSELNTSSNTNIKTIIPIRNNPYAGINVHKFNLPRKPLKRVE